MKSGSTFISRTLAQYYGAECIEPVPYWGRLEQNLHEHLIAPHLDQSFVLQLHLMPHVPNLELIRKLGISVVWVWRNLGDVIVSFDDHICNEDHRNPVCYVQDRDRYLAMPLQRRYRYLIEHALPWYLGFYLSWRALRPTLPYVETHYEQLAADPCSYFDDVIRGLGGEPDQARLHELVASRPPGTRFNKGVNGRSRELLSEYNRHLLEDKLRSHCEDVRELLAELPWAEDPPRSRLLARAGNGRALAADVTITPSFQFDAESTASAVVQTLAPASVVAAGADAERLAEALRSLGVDAVASSSLTGLPARCFDLIVCASALDESTILASAEALERAACLLLFEYAPECVVPLARLGLTPDLAV